MAFSTDNIMYIDYLNEKGLIGELSIINKGLATQNSRLILLSFVIVIQLFLFQL